jgi:RNA polymerase subunit RPABC4/transcription elongation factor Spt4
MNRHRIWGWVAALVCVAVLGSGAAVMARPAAKAKHAAAKGMYVCTMCHVGSAKAGRCPMCQMEMKAAAYACPTCDATSNKAGTCAACGKPMAKVADMSKKCSACGYYVSKDAKSCPVCAAKKSGKG